MSDNTGFSNLAETESFTLVAPIIDTDSDGVADNLDNCPLIPNAVDSWTSSSEQEQRRHATVTRLGDGRIVVAAGVINDPIEGTIYLDDVQVWSADGQSLLQSNSNCLAGGRALHAATRISSNRVLITGGWNGTSSLDSAYVYDAATNTCSSVGPMAAPRSQHTATLVNGLSQEVFIAGGWSVGGPTASTEFYTDLVIAGTPRFSVGPTLAAARNTHTATFVRDCPAFINCSTGDVYLAGGYGPAATLTSIEFFDRSTN